MGIAWLEDLRVDLMHEVCMQITTLHVTPSYVCCHPLAKLKSTFTYLGRMLCSVAGQGRQWGFLAHGAVYWAGLTWSHTFANGSGPRKWVTPTVGDTHQWPWV